MRDAGLVDEVRSLAARAGGLSRTARQAIGYKELFAYLDGSIEHLDDALDLAIRRTTSFARRQRVWFRRDPRIVWIGTDGNAEASERALLATWSASRPVPARSKMTTMHLSKLHATGNDFLVRLALDDVGAGEDGAPADDLDPVVVAALCNRHYGVGADGLITIRPGRNGADCTMTLVNADGGLAEMSGNGVRCLAWVAARRASCASRSCSSTPRPVGGA